MAGQMFVACETGVLFVDGEPIVVHKDHTRVDEGHALVEQYPEMFKPLEAHFKVETARQEPVVAPQEPVVPPRASGTKGSAPKKD